MPRHPGCALLVFASVRVLTQPFAEQAGIGRMLQRGCDHPVTVPVFSSQLQSVRIPRVMNGAGLSYGPRND